MPLIDLHDSRRRSRRLLGLLGLLALLFALSQAHAWLGRGQAGAAMADRQRLVVQLGLTDLCLFTEARYTRHPSQADLHSPLQDHPLALEHFPSGSLMPAPHSLQAAGHE
jgi:hypothetical protein